MKMKLATGLAVVLLAIGIAACSPAARKADASSSAAATGPIRAKGVVKSVLTVFDVCKEADNIIERRASCSDALQIVNDAFKLLR